MKLEMLCTLGAILSHHGFREGSETRHIGKQAYCVEAGRRETWGIVCERCVGDGCGGRVEVEDGTFVGQVGWRWCRSP